MNSESYGTTSENLLMARKDLAVLKDLFHTLNDSGISLSSLNCSIALLEKYIEESNTECRVSEENERRFARKSRPRNYNMWKSSNIIFASRAV